MCPLATRPTAVKKAALAFSPRLRLERSTSLQRSPLDSVARHAGDTACERRRSQQVRRLKMLSVQHSESDGNAHSTAAIVESETV